MARENLSSLRQVRYNLLTDPSEQDLMKHSWAFFILNAPREIQIIQQKILKEFANCTDLVKLESGVLVREGSLVGRLITFDSEIGEIQEKNKIYAAGKWYYDRTLRRMDDIQFDKYCSKFKV